MVVVLFIVIPKKEVAFDHESVWQYCNMVRSNNYSVIGRPEASITSGMIIGNRYTSENEA